MIMSGSRSSPSERGAGGGRREMQLVARVSAVAVSAFAVVLSVLGLSVVGTIREGALEDMAAANQARARYLSAWIEMNVGALRQVVSSPEVTSTELLAHEPILGPSWRRIRISRWQARSTSRACPSRAATAL